MPFSSKKKALSVHEADTEAQPISTPRAQIDGVSETPSIAQMMPQTRHYSERNLIFENFKDHFKDNNEFTKIYGRHSCESIGAEYFSKKWFVPGAFFSQHPYQLKDAVSLFGFVLSAVNSLATRSAILYHCNYREFQDQFKQRRPTELTQAHSSFRPIYESLFTETDFRPSYVAVIGFDEPRWSLSHEKRLVHVLLELIASGIVSEDKLDLAELVSLPSIPFLEFEPLKKAPEAKRLRFSSGSPNDSQLSLQSPEENLPTEQLQPRPAWAHSLVSLQNDSDLGIAALLEILLLNHGELAKHEQRTEDAFKFILWKLASEKVGHCTFESPLASLGHKNKLRASDLVDAFNHLDRCSHLQPPNVRASRHRETLLVELTSLKTSFVTDMEGLRVPAAVLRMFDLKQPIAAWFPNGDKQETLSYLYAGLAEDDPKDGQARKRRPTRGSNPRRLRTSRLMSEVSPIDDAQPWIIPHPINGTAWLSDQSAAILRLLRADGGTSKVRQPVIFALMYTFFFRKRPPIELLISGAALDLAERRISARDHVILIEEIKSNLARDRYAMFYSLFDDTHHRSGERHVYFLSYFDWVKSTPVSKLVSLKPSPSKDAITNAKEDMINIESLFLEAGRHGGSTSDHAAMAEGRELGKLVIAESLEAASRPGGAALRKLFVQAVLGDEQHKHPLVWEALDEAIFGVDPGTIQFLHHKQLLFQLRFMVEKGDKGAILEEMAKYMGFPRSKNASMPRKMCPTRWNTVGVAAENWLGRKDELDCRGVAAFPGLFFHMANRETKHSVPYKGWMFLATNCIDPRFNVAMTWEVEHNVRWTEVSTWNRSPSRQGFKSGFRIMDIIERSIYEDEIWWDRARENPANVYPRTMELISLMSPDLCAQYNGFMRKGILTGFEEHRKLYAYQKEPKFLLLYMFCRGKSGSCVRVIAYIIAQRLEAFKEADFLYPILERPDDMFFRQLLDSEQAKAEVFSYFLHWGLDNPVVLSDLVLLSKNLQHSRIDDIITDDFVHGRSCVSLFRHVCVTMAPLATTCVIVELLYSQMKIVMEANETSESVDDELRLIFNVLNDDRRLRRELAANTKTRDRDNHTKEQLVVLCEQALQLSERYNWTNMKDIRGRRSFIGSLENADSVTSKRGADVKNGKKEARVKVNVTAEEIASFQAAAFSTPLPVQRKEAALLAITQRQRIYAVVMEESVPGQATGELVFWTQLTGGAESILLEARKVLPFIHSILTNPKLKVNGIRRVQDKAVSTVMTRSSPRRLQLRDFPDYAGELEWVTVACAWPGPKVLQVDKLVQSQHGLTSIIRSLCRAFFGRECSWKKCSGAVEGEVPVKGGLIQRGLVCPHCVRDDRNLQHWGCVSCFLTVRERKAIGICILMNTYTSNLLRKNSLVAQAASKREGRSWT